MRGTCHHASATTTGRVAVLLLCVALVCPPAWGQSLFDPATVQDIRIVFSRDDWRAALDSAKTGDGAWLVASRVRINGALLRDVGVKFKGRSSYDPSNAKNSLTLELNHVRHGQAYDGINSLKLNNAYADPSFIREALGYDIARTYMDAPRCNFARVTINGAPQGLFSNVEAVDRRFLRTRFGSSTGAFFKCVPEQSARGDTPDLVWRGPDSASYASAYEIKSKGGWSRLLALIAALSSPSARIEDLLDVDRALWMLAFNTVTLNLDSYTGNTAHNYFLCEDASGRFVPVIWDLNMSFGTCAEISPGRSVPRGELARVTPLLHADDAARPLISRLLADSTRRRMYFAHIRTMLREQISSGVYRTRAEAWMQTIAAPVQTDDRKFFPEIQFRRSLREDIHDGTRIIPGIIPLMEARAAFLLGLAELRAPCPVIGSVHASRTGIATSFFVPVAQASAVYLGYRSVNGAPFARVRMQDDGRHLDGAADDGVYGVVLPGVIGDISYYVYAENSTAGVFLPERAEHETMELR
jgi:hypothetical protein